MILSNVEIVSAIKSGVFNISPFAGMDPTQSPFNTSAVDLRLRDKIQIPKPGPAAFDLRKPDIASFLDRNSEILQITDDQPFPLKPNRFILGQTIELVDFPLRPGQRCYSARVEGKSSIARTGIIVHFTAPTIHAGYKGPITLELINLGPMDFLLYPRMFICQLIVEEVSGNPLDAPNQFKGQTNPAGIVPHS